jgi:putative transposase|uniref:Transposase n=1 Tax=Meiothermus ruber TaxID=277 RepID=A0A7C3I5H3_MEIRU
MELRESRYPSDLTDQELAILAPLMPQPSSSSHRPREHPWREILNGIFYITRAGCAWRMMPCDLPHWKTVYHYFRFLQLVSRTLMQKASKVKLADACLS